MDTSFSFQGILGLLSAWNLRSMTFGGDVRVSSVYAILSKTCERKTYGEATTPTVAAD